MVRVIKEFGLEGLHSKSEETCSVSGCAEHGRHTLEIPNYGARKVNEVKLCTNCYLDYGLSYWGATEDIDLCLVG